MNYEEAGLFEVQKATSTFSTIEEVPISEVQVEAIRAAFDSAGVVEMAERKEIIQGSLFRNVTTIRDLYSREVDRVLNQIKSRNVEVQIRSGSAWDNRDEDTWIDKL